MSWHHSSHSLEIPRQHGELSDSFYLPSTLSCTRATKEASRFGGCGQLLHFVIKCILGVKRIFPCSFGNKRMRLLTCVYGTLQKHPDSSNVDRPQQRWTRLLLRRSALLPHPSTLELISLLLVSGASLCLAFYAWPPPPPKEKKCPPDIIH